MKRRSFLKSLLGLAVSAAFPPVVSEAAEKFGVNSMTLGASEWTHISIPRCVSAFSLYINGVELDSAEYTVADDKIHLKNPLPIDEWVHVSVINNNLNMTEEYNVKSSGVTTYLSSNVASDFQRDKDFTIEGFVYPIGEGFLDELRITKG